MSQKDLSPSPHKAVAAALLGLALALSNACSGGTTPPAPPAAAGTAAPRADTSAASLQSWNSGRAKDAITGFVARVTTVGGPDFVPVAERVAVFDNDGTLWGEQPVYTQVMFALDRVKALAPQHPEWKGRQPFQSVIDGDMKGVMASGEKGLIELIGATHTGMSTDEFAAIVSEWIGAAKHQKTQRPYTEMVYQPMLEVLAYLRANGFKTYIVSGGGVEFMRPWTDRVYGIPPEQVVGSRAKLEYRSQAKAPALLRLPAIDLVDDRAGKPVGIQQQIGRRPIAAFGNSDGDFEMLEWTTAGAGPRFGMLVHHTDAEREWAYDRESHIGTLARALDEAPARGWIVVDMKSDWSRIYPFQP